MSDFFAPAPEPSTPLGRFRILSPRAGVRVSPFALGGMSFGKAWEGFMGSMDKEGTFKLLDGFHEAGGNFIDTANNYQNEESELWIGEWLEKNGLRDQFVIATKYTTNYKAYEIGKNPARNLTGNHKKSLKTSLRDSLKKLRTDYVDILYLHWWDFTTSIEEIMDSLHNEVVAGRVLYLGVSDTPAWIVAACNTYATAHGKTPFVVYQGRWNVMIRDLEREIIPMCRQFGMAITPWDAIGGGRLQSKKQMEAKKQAGEGIRAMMGGAEQTEDEVKYSQVLTEIAEKHGLESPTVVALAYVMNKAPYVFPIVGGRKVEHLKENIKAINLKLTDEEIKQIEDIKPFDPSFPHNFIGPDPHFHELGAFVKGQIGTVDFVKGPYSL